MALKFAAHKVTEWWFLECGSGGLLRMPFSPEETLVVGREHAADDEARYVSRVLAFYQGEIICDEPPEAALVDPQVREFVIGEHAPAGARGSGHA